MPATVVEIEAIVEAGRVPPLRVLEDRLELVEALGQSRFERAAGLIVIPERNDVGANIRGKGRYQLEKSVAWRPRRTVSWLIPSFS